MSLHPARPANPSSRHPRNGEDGFLLLGAIVMVALILITLAIAAPIVARDLRRVKELEAVHRGNQYVRAIQVYYRKFGRYPGSIEQLEGTNNIRFLRKHYLDPINGQDDFAIIPVGQNKTTVKTFFGAPLAGLNATGVGSVAGMLSPGIGIGANPAGAPGPTSISPSGAAAPGAGSPAAGATGVTATAPSMSSTGTANPAASGQGGSSSPFGASSSPGSPGGGLSQPFMGVTLGAKGDSIIELNEQTDYGTWEFLYDPRLDQLKARAAALNGGGPGSMPGSSLGQPSVPTGLTSSPSATPSGSTSPAAPTTSPTTPP